MQETKFVINAKLLLPNLHGHEQEHRLVNGHGHGYGHGRGLDIDMEISVSHSDSKLE